MFTGIISKTSKVKNIKSKKGGLRVEIANNLGKVKPGESIAVNGICSTARKSGKNIYLEYMPESLKLSNLGFLKKNDIVNLEQSMRLNDRLSGHIVLGHIDGKSKIISIKKEGNSRVFKLEISDKQFKKFLVYKGAIAIEGISLTITRVLNNFFTVKILPYTLKHTNLKNKKEGDFVNLEFDILAKYIHANKK